MPPTAPHKIRNLEDTGADDLLVMENHITNKVIMFINLSVEIMNQTSCSKLDKPITVLFFPLSQAYAWKHDPSLPHPNLIMVVVYH
jgi:hypothetical protein